jgi:predicted dehydrogenase
VQITGVYAGGSEQFSLSRERVGKFSAEIESRYHIPSYATIPDLVKDVDVLFLTSVDGRQHPEQFNQMAVGKPVFIDKPFAVSTADAAVMIELAAATATPIMSCSSLRYAEGISGLAQMRDQFFACEAFGPMPILPDYPGYFWYGIHCAEILFLLLGVGCQSVRVVAGDKMDVISATWQDGRSGAILGSRFEGYEFGVLVQTRGGSQLAIAKDTPPYHACLAREIVRFFQSGRPPVDIHETYQIIAFLEAANQSRSQNGAPVALAALPAQTQE